MEGIHEPLVADFHLALAVVMAQMAHRNQLDKAEQPFIGHPLRVMAYLAPDPIVMTIGVLHDIVEDTPVTLTVIHAQFGDRIANAVDALSRHKDEKYWDYIDRCVENDDAREVKVADLFDNSNPHRATPECFEELRGLVKTRYIKALDRIHGPRLPADWLTAWQLDRSNPA